MCQFCILDVWKDDLIKSNSLPVALIAINTTGALRILALPEYEDQMVRMLRAAADGIEKRTANRTEREVTPDHSHLQN
jgi:hypothetical protein